MAASIKEHQIKCMSVTVITVDGYVSLLRKQRVVKHAFCCMGVGRDLKFKQWCLVSGFAVDQIRRDVN